MKQIFEGSDGTSILAYLQFALRLFMIAKPLKVEVIVFRLIISVFRIEYNHTGYATIESALNN